MNYNLRFRGGSTQKSIEKFEKVAEKTENKLKYNPYSENYEQPKFDKTKEDYGRPVSGSKTEARARRAGQHVTQEIIFLCEIIKKHAEGEPPNCFIKFGPLFNIYSHYSDKLVGMLIRARKYGLVHFDGEMLYQKQDDNKKIKLLKTLDEIRNSVQFSGDPVNCISILK